MMAVAEGLRSEVDLQICALDNAPVTVEETLREELKSRFAAVTFVRRRWELRLCFRTVDAVLWYGVVNAVPDVLASLASSEKDRPASVRIVHTDRAVDGPGFHRRWRRVIDRTICVSPAVARRIPGAEFIPNTCSMDRLRGERREMFPPGRPTLGFLGRLVPQKNAAWLVENAAALDFNLLIQALDTPLQSVADLERLAEQQGTAGRVRFLPPGRDVGTLLRSVDAVVIASRHEGFPMVAVEAGFLGVPVIATRVGALPEVFPEQILFIESGEDGLPELSSMRSALAQVGPTIEPVWGRRLQERVEELCSREAVVGRYLEVLKSVQGPLPGTGGASPASGVRRGGCRGREGEAPGILA
jgi:glycosyltransferase involved in cell wall biosynthesis